jgi:glycosyltransferase involved in cell wall biosynthesis
MMDRPIVSVVIPTYNRKDFLGRAVASVLNQTFQSFEIIVVDDASQDNAEATVRGFRDGRLKYVRHTFRKGGSAARNTGILESRSDYVAFLDDDDEWLPKKLEKQIAVLEQSPASTGAVYTGYFVVDSLSGANLRERTAVKRGNLLNELLVHNCVGGTSSVIVKRECFERVGLFDEDLPSFQDYDLWIRMGREYNFDCISEPLGKYYVHEKKIWTNLEALSQGIEGMLKKHGTARSLRRWLSYQYLSIGEKYCHNRDIDKGRKAYIRAIQLNPFAVRYYRNLCLSFLSPRNLAMLRSLKRNLAWGIRMWAR